MWLESLKLYFTESPTKDESGAWAKEIIDSKSYLGPFFSRLYFLDKC